MRSITGNIDDILKISAYYPGVPDTYGNAILPLSDEVEASDEVADQMDVRDNMINPYTAWQKAAINAIPNVESLGFDTDNGFETIDGDADYGDDIPDISNPVLPLIWDGTGPGPTVTDEIHFIWPSPREEHPGYVPYDIDIDFFRWTPPENPEEDEMYRQHIVVKVPDYPKFLPWLTLTHGRHNGIVDGAQSFTFVTSSWEGEKDYLLGNEK